MRDLGFVHLNTHSEYSLKDSIITIDSYIAKAKSLGMSAVALTDNINMFACVKFYNKAIQAGIKPIFGADIYLKKIDNKFYPKLTILCQNNIGLHNLYCLISKAYSSQVEHIYPVIDYQDLEELNAGLIILSGGIKGEIGFYLLNNKNDLAHSTLNKYKNTFGDRFYLELSRINAPNEDKYNNLILELAIKYKTPIVATNSVRFIEPNDYEAHEARCCIASGDILANPKRKSNFTKEQYFKSSEMMQELFSDLPQAIANSHYIAKRCNVKLDLGKVFLPHFPVPQGLTIDQYLSKEAKKGLEERFTTISQLSPNYSKERYYQRLEHELEVIIKMGFPGYFLIVSDFIHWAKKNNIPVGPGRGSGAGSLVAYALKITDLDPIHYELLFERFLNPERVSMPDFDIDFCIKGRDRVIEYVSEAYGSSNVGQIITFGTMAAKAVIRDVGRVLGFPYGFVDKIAKLIPFEIGMTLNKALEQEETLANMYNTEDDVKQIFELAKKLEGLTRNVGKHAGGVVIAPSKLTDFSPLYQEVDSNVVVTQFDKDDVESAGLVKFDFLGLKTLTIIDWAVRTINHNNDNNLDINLIPLDCPKTYELLKACKTTAVFQLESRGMKDLIKRLEPDELEDIIALVALFRPGPLQSGMVDDYINRKHGRAHVEYAHPLLEPILKPTRGVILYQEQVMQIAQSLAGYSLGAADLLRRAMGKKKPEEMAKQREVFVTGATQNNIDEATATYIFDLMEKFAGYGFNRSHSAAYGLLSYQTAYLKANYKAEFMSAVLSADIQNTDKIIILVEDCKALNLKILPPDINSSEFLFTVNKDKEILYGLGAIKGVGEGAILSITQERNTNGSFKDLFEMLKRTTMRKINRKTLEALIFSGALDSLNTREYNLSILDDAIRNAQQITKANSLGQAELFFEQEIDEQPNIIRNNVAPWSKREKLGKEKQSLGFYLSGHPLDEYKTVIKRIAGGNIASLTLAEKKLVKFVGEVKLIRTILTKRNQKMAFVNLADSSGDIEVAVFSDLYEKTYDAIRKDNLLFITGEASFDKFSESFRIRANDIKDFYQAKTSLIKAVNLNLVPKESGSFANLKLKLQALCEAGSAKLNLSYQTSHGYVKLRLNNEWLINPDEETLEKLNALPEVATIESIY